MRLTLIKHSAALPWIQQSRYDVCDKFGFYETDYALKHPRVKDDLNNILSNPKRIQKYLKTAD